MCRVNGETAHLISKASGAQLSMYLAKLKQGGSAPMPAKGIERLFFGFSRLTNMVGKCGVVGDLLAQDICISSLTVFQCSMGCNSRCHKQPYTDLHINFVLCLTGF